MYILWQDNRLSRGVQTDVKISEACKLDILRCQQRMVEDVVEINSNFQSGLFGEGKEFLETHIDSPGAWSKQRISFRYCRVVKNVRAGRGYGKSVRVKEPIRPQ